MILPVDFVFLHSASNFAPRNRIDGPKAVLAGRVLSSCPLAVYYGTSIALGDGRKRGPVCQIVQTSCNRDVEQRIRVKRTNMKASTMLGPFPRQ